MDTRRQQIVQWIEKDLGYNNYALEIASADASFRRYFRLEDKVNGDTKIIMDAPPEKEDSHPFIKIANSLEQLGLNVPKVYAQNFEQGFFLLSDLGSTDYLTKINDSNADQLYQDAMQALLTLQSKNKIVLPAYNLELLSQEMHLFIDWFLLRHKQLELSTSDIKMLEGAFDFLAQTALAQPQVSVHRDYHSRNLMVTAEQNPGVLDFQDAVIGPVTYDLVSLLRDCYVTWPADKVEKWLKHYHQIATNKGILQQVTYQQLEVWFDLMGLQRHLKAVGIFSRLNYRDGKVNYLNDIPRTMKYVTSVSEKYTDLKEFNAFVNKLA